MDGWIGSEHAISSGFVTTVVTMMKDDARRSFGIPDGRDLRNESRMDGWIDRMDGSIERLSSTED